MLVLKVLKVFCHLLCQSLINAVVLFWIGRCYSYGLAILKLFIYSWNLSMFQKPCLLFEYFVCLKVDRATRCNCSWMADGREKSLRRATSRRAADRHRAHVRRARRRNHCLATTALATYVRKVCSRATRKHTDGFFDFHSDFFRSLEIETSLTDK